MKSVAHLEEKEYTVNNKENITADPAAQTAAGQMPHRRRNGEV